MSYEAKATDKVNSWINWLTKLLSSTCSRMNQFLKSLTPIYRNHPLRLLKLFDFLFYALKSIAQVFYLSLKLY
ncbi:hypothetical protein ACET3Z_011891 [Daucus carota]